jgi:hypothetical protein
MYCPHCGTESTQGLNYCNRCGGNLGSLATSAAQEVVRPAISTGTAWAVGSTTILLVLVGLAIILGAMSDLVHNIPADAVAFIMICGSMTLLGSVFMLTRFWTRMLAGARQSGLAEARRTAASELGPARVGALLPDTPPPPASSVTEHTTRTLEAQRGTWKTER